MMPGVLLRAARKSQYVIRGDAGKRVRNFRFSLAAWYAGIHLKKGFANPGDIIDNARTLNPWSCLSLELT